MIKENKYPFSGILIASDIDGTFLGERSEVLGVNVKAIERFKALGGYFTFSTGRTASALCRLVPNAAEIANAPAILTNGALITDLKTGRVIDARSLDPKEAREVLRDIIERFPSVGMRISQRERFVCPHTNEKLTRELKRFSDMTSFTDLDEISPENWDKVVFSAKYEELCEVADHIKTAYKGRYAVSSSCATLLEMLEPDATKGKRVTEIKKLLSEKTGKDFVSIGVGDYDNDLDMLRSADIGACPENALDEVKAVCRYHLCHHRDGAIADLIGRLEKEMGGTGR